MDVFSSADYLEVEKPACTLLAQTFGDKLFLHYKKQKEKRADVHVSPITEREMDVLQYLGGNVVKKEKWMYCSI